MIEKNRQYISYIVASLFIHLLTWTPARLLEIKHTYLSGLYLQIKETLKV